MRPGSLSRVCGGLLAGLPAWTGALCAAAIVSATAGDMPDPSFADAERPIWDYSLEDLMGITVVTPSKTEERLLEAPSVVSVISWKEIEGYGANTLFDVLDRAAGLYIYGSYYLPNNMITINGDATSHYCTHVLLLIDGRPFHSSKEGYDLPFLAGFPLSVIDHIEILRGPGSALYGTTAYAGAINVITRKPEEQPTLASAGTGSFGTRSANLATAFRKGPLGFSLGTTIRTSEGWNHRVRDADDDGLLPYFDAPTPERSFGIHSTVSWDKLKLSAFAGQHYMMNGYELQYFGTGWPELNLGTTHAVVDLGWANAFSETVKLDLNATWNYQHYWQPFDVNANDVREYAYSNDGLLEATGHFQPRRDLRITTGALASLNTGYINNNQQSADGSDYDIWANPPNPDPFQVVPEYRETFVSGYVNAAWSPWDRLKLIAGFHANKAPDLDLDVVPRAGVVAGLGEHLTWKVLYGEAFRSPDVFERFSTINVIFGDSQLKPERIATTETQIVYARRNLSGALSVFYSAQRNLINRKNVRDTVMVHGTPIEIIQIFHNEGYLDSRGGTLEGNAQVARYLSMTASLTYQEVENRESPPVTDLFGVPNLFAKYGISYARPQFSAGLFLSRFDYLDEVAGYPVRHPDANPPAESFNYATLDVKVNWKSILGIRSATPEITSEANLVNLLDESIQYPEHGRRYVNSTPGRPGFAAYFGVKVGL